ncbi:MAG: hypothetical protein K5925_02060 [Bacilli bacterium]|nr:hypothetical protein [Bacilli bacterium]
MIDYYDKSLIVELFEHIFSIALTRRMNPKALEHLISNSRIANDLEKGDSSFLNDCYKPKLIEDLFKAKLTKEEWESHYDICLWVSMMYVSLLFKYKKSFEYLFLYISIEEMHDKFYLYHEMDITQLYSYFEMKVNKKTLLSSLMKKHHYSSSSLSVASGISVNTIEKYCKSDEALYRASYENIYMLSHLLHVKSNIFARQLILADEITKYRNDYDNMIEKLGLFFACYYDRNIAKEKFEYDKSTQRYRSAKINDLFLLVIKNINELPEKSPIDYNTILVLVMNEVNIEKEELAYFKRIIVISENEAYDLDKNSKKPISNDVRETSVVLLEKDN